MESKFTIGSAAQVTSTFVVVLLAAFATNSWGQGNCVSPPSGLVAWWPAEGNGFDVADGNNATQTNGITFVPGMDGLAFNFDGTTSLMTVPGSPSLNVSNLTIEAWIYVTDLSTPRPIFEYGDSTGPMSLDFWYNLGVGGQPLSGAIFAFARDGANFNNNFNFASTGGVLHSNQWSHVAFTFDSLAQTAGLFLNGVSVASTSFTVPVHPNTTLSVNLGYRPVGSSDLYAGFRHLGKLDEVSLYNRALSPAEIQAIYQAGSAGKCAAPIAPAIVVQPSNQSAAQGGSASFSVLAAGTAPLGYQWLFGGNKLPGAIAPTLTLGAVQPADFGSYAVIVSNAFGSVTSSIVKLALGTCAAIPSGLVSWWSGESNALDLVSGNNGIFHGGVSIVPGKVGNGFGFDGTGFIVISNSPTLNYSNQLTIELWYNSTQDNSFYYTIIDKRVGATIANYGINNAPNNGLGVFYDDPTVEDGDDTPFGSAFEVSRYSPAPAPGVFHHLAATYQQLTNNQVQLQTFLEGQLVRTRVINGNLANTLNSSPITIGAAAQGAGEFFKGVIDEIAIYDRVLAPGEVQAIYNAGAIGKCISLVPPSFVEQPLGQNLFTGASATFTAVAAGSLPLSYQWQKDSVILNGATGSTLTLTNLQLGDAGSYSVSVSNSAGIVSSSPALLAVTTPPPCQAPPSGLIGWWKADGSATDSVGGNNGTLQNGAGFTAGEVQQAFAFNGINQFVEIPDAPVLDPTNSLTVETWVYVSGNPNTDLATIVTKASTSVPQLNQYQLETHYNGARLNFRALVYLPSGYGYVDGNTSVQFNTWYHVAMTYDSSSLKLYVNGALDGSVAASGAIAPTTEPLRFGGMGGGPWFFNGRVDEVGLYNRALSMPEIQSVYNAGAAGKCVVPIAPFIVTQPQSQDVTVGTNANINVAAAGSVPLSYQWLFNGTPVPGATTNSLILSNVSKSDAGSYSVVVTNVTGSVTSSVAILTVSPGPSVVQVSDATVASDGTVTVPVSLVANGSENAVGFSLNFDPTLLTNQAVVLGSGASAGSLLFNSSQVSSGRLGVAVALPAGQTFGAGTQQLVLVTFSSPIIASGTSTAIAFGDAPIKRLVADVSGAAMPTAYVSGAISLPPAEVEGDVYPRPNGDQALTVSDWVLVGRYVARLDYPTNDSEFQRADCAPRSTLGDGALTVSDWVQAGRYAAGLDPVTRMGGPTSAVPAVVSGPMVAGVTPKTVSNARQVKVVAPVLAQGQVGAAEIVLEAQGDENALGFSLAFDPAKLIFAGATASDTASGSVLNLNANAAAQGRLGVVLALKANRSFVPGSKQLISVSFRAAASVSGTAAISFSDLPVPRGISDPNAGALAADYIDAVVVVNPRPSLKIAQSPGNLNLSWPAAATGFVLQESSDPALAPTSWKTVPITPAVANNQNVVSAPVSLTNRFYRLYHP